ncbi:hypothetical protein HUN19_15235, partial [Acinetobacter oleivorans]|nr:hypothetical protein [Acinetobacter oleivorans]
MFNKQNIACLFLVLFSLKSYAKEDFNLISQCTDEYETSCNVVLTVNGKKSILLRNIKSPNIEKVSEDIFHVVSSCGSPCVG